MEELFTFLSSFPKRSAIRETSSKGNPIELIFFASDWEEGESFMNVSSMGLDLVVTIESFTLPIE